MSRQRARPRRIRSSLNARAASEGHIGRRIAKLEPAASSSSAFSGEPPGPSLLPTPVFPPNQGSRSVVASPEAFSVLKNLDLGGSFCLLGERRASPVGGLGAESFTRSPMGGRGRRQRLAGLLALQIGPGAPSPAGAGAAARRQRMIAPSGRRAGRTTARRPSSRAAARRDKGSAQLTESNASGASCPLLRRRPQRGGASACPSRAAAATSSYF